MKKIYADLHIHIGRTFTGRAVKITGAKTLTLDRILVEASEHKGIELLGIIDCHSPEVILELEEGISSGKYRELDGEESVIAARLFYWGASWRFMMKPAADRSMCSYLCRRWLI